MADIEAKQFRVSPAGEILFQPDVSNPLPGDRVGMIARGEAALRPVIALDEGAPEAAVVQAWLAAHIDTVLEPLKLIKDDEAIAQPARDLLNRLHDAMGILPRADLEDLIALLDDEGRRALRARKVRMGPLLVFLPALTKPASVRLRALLWNLWHGKPFPAFVPADGITSISVAGQEMDGAYMRAIGYPVYGPRAVRVDMLDRLVVAVYDSADKGLFKARHEMAEWLGCPIADLYAVLEAMDHKKIHDPADAIAAKPEETRTEAEPVAEVEAVPAPAPVTESVPAEPVAESAAAPAVASAAKPELATFRLRRGKAYGAAPERARPSSRPAHHKIHVHAETPDAQQRHGGARDGAGEDSRKKSQGRPQDKKQREERPRHDRTERPERGARPPKGERTERVISVGPQKKAEDSPFAMLKNLKVQGKE